MKETVQVPVSYRAASTEAPSSQSDVLFDEVNSYRNSMGSPDLQRHAGLDRLARSHCEYMRENRGTFNVYGKNVSHMGDTGRSLIAIRRFGMTSTSENVAWIEYCGNETQTAKWFVKKWKDSPDHEYAMRSKYWTHTGVAAVVADDGSVFATQLFSTIDNSQMSIREYYNNF